MGLTRAAICIGTILFLAAAARAEALGTTPNPIQFDFDIDVVPPAGEPEFTLAGTITFLDSQLGTPTNGVVHLPGVLDEVPDGHTTLSFQISLTEGGITDIEMNIGALPNSSACGSIPGTGDLGLTLGCAFEGPGLGLLAGQTSDIVFFSFGNIEPGDLVRFSFGDFVSIPIGEAVVTVPEPSTGWLLAISGCLAIRAARQGAKGVKKRLV